MAVVATRTESMDSSDPREPESPSVTLEQAPAETPAGTSEESPVYHSAEPSISVPEWILQPAPAAPGSPDVDDFRPSPRRPPSLFARFPAMNRWLPVAFCGLLMLGFSFYAWRTGPQLWSVHGRDLLGGGEYWRALTALFTHADEGHLASNLLPLMFFGWLLYGYFGPLFFPVLPIALGIASNVITTSLYHPDVALVGASGMVYAMMGLWLMLYWRFDRGRPWAERTLRMAGFILMMVVPQGTDPQTSVLAHASGFLLGLGVGAVAAPLAKLRIPPPPRRR